MWHEFYVHRGLIPASNVLYPWALPGTPGNPLFRRPAADTKEGRALAALQARKLAELFQDFAATPPDVLAVIEPLARAADSDRVTDVPGLKSWIDAHCRPMGRTKDGNGRPAALYDCRGGAPASPP